MVNIINRFLNFFILFNCFQQIFNANVLILEKLQANFVSYLNYFSNFDENGLITYYPIYYFIVELNQNIILKDCDSFIEVINLVVRLNFQFLEILNLFDYLNLVFTNDFRLIDCLVTYHNYVQLIFHGLFFDCRLLVKVFKIFAYLVNDFIILVDSFAFHFKSFSEFDFKLGQMVFAF